MDEKTVARLEEKYSQINDVFEFCYTKYSKTSGIVYGWGRNDHGQLTGDQKVYLVPKEITELGTVKSIFADRGNSFVIKGGKLAAAGKMVFDKDGGDLDSWNPWEPGYTEWIAPQPGILPTIKSFATCGRLCFAIDTSDKLWSWGKALRGYRYGEFDATPRIVDSLRNYKIKQVEFGKSEGDDEIGCCLTTDGEVFTWEGRWGFWEKLDIEPISQISCGVGIDVTYSHDLKLETFM